MKWSSALLSILLLMLTGCGLYRMPSDESISTLPVTNNPLLTREQSPSPVPGV